MESIRKTPASLLASSAKIFIHGALWALDFFYTFAGKFATDALDLRQEVVNFTLSFPNGEDQDFQVSKNNYESYTAKRMRLILDISCLPNGTYQILSATNEPEAETPKNIYVIAKDFSADYTFRSTRAIKLILQEVESLIDGEESLTVYTNGVGEDRRKLSPRKRLPQPRSRPLKRFMSRVWEILGIFKPAHTLFDPVEPHGYISFDNSLNNSKLKTSEKRKHPELDESSESSETEDEFVAEEDTAADQIQTPNEIVMNGNGELVQDSDINSSNHSTPNGYSNINGRAYLDIEEEYQSADDPDFKPSPSPSVSSGSDSSMSDDSPDIMKQELEDLKSDAAKEVSFDIDAKIPEHDHNYHQ